MEWSFNDGLPIYSQLIHRFKAAVASGELKPGEKLQSVRDLALEAKVNPNTMQRALSELEREGLLFTQRTSGRFVTEELERLDALRASLAREQVTGYFEAMKSIGFSREEALKYIGSFTEGNNDDI